MKIAMQGSYCVRLFMEFAPHLESFQKSYVLRATCHTVSPMLQQCILWAPINLARSSSMCQHFSVWKVSFFVREFSQGSQIVASELSLDVIATCRATKLRLIWCFSPLASTCKDLGWRNWTSTAFPVCCHFTVWLRGCIFVGLFPGRI